MEKSELSNKNVSNQDFCTFSPLDLLHTTFVLFGYIYFFYGGQLVEHTPHVKLFVFLSHALCSVECQPDFTVNLHLQLQAKLQVPSI